MEIGRRVRELRKAAGLGKQKLCSLAGDLSLSQLHRLERGENPWPRLDTIERIAAALGREAWELLAPEEVVRMVRGPTPNSEDSKIYFLGKTPLAETERRGWARALLGTEDVTQADEEALARLVGELDEAERLLVSRALDVLADHAERLAPPDAAEPAKPRAKARRRAR